MEILVFGLVLNCIGETCTVADGFPRGYANMEICHSELTQLKSAISQPPSGAHNVLMLCGEKTLLVPGEFTAPAQ